VFDLCCERQPIEVGPAFNSKHYGVGKKINSYDWIAIYRGTGVVRWECAKERKDKARGMIVADIDREQKQEKAKDRGGRSTCGEVGHAARTQFNVVLYFRNNI